MFGVASRATFFSSAATTSSGVFASFNAVAAWPVSAWSVLLLEPLGPVGGLGGEEFFQVDRGRCAVGLGRLDGDRAALGHFEVEAHHRLVDRADLLDVERAVAEPLAVEDEQVLEHAEDDAVGDARRLGPLARLSLRALAACLRGTDSGPGRTDTPCGVAASTRRGGRRRRSGGRGSGAAAHAP